MASYSTNEFRSGLKLILDGDPYSIIENDVRNASRAVINPIKYYKLKIYIIGQM